MLCAVLGVFHPPLDFNNRYLALGSFLLLGRFAYQKFASIWFTTAHDGPRHFSAVAFFHFVVLSILTLAPALLCFYQLGLTPPRLDAFLSGWAHAHPAQRDTTDTTVLWPVEVRNKYGFIDKTGALVISAQFDAAQSLSEGVAAVCFGRCDFVDTKRKTEDVLFPNQRVYEGAWGYVNGHGQMVITPQFSMASEFSQGLAAVCVGERFVPDDHSPWHCGYIDHSGKLVIPAQFSYSREFDDSGIAGVSVGSGEDTRWGFINKSGRFLINPQFPYAENFRDGLAIVHEKKTDTQPSYIDRTGRYVWRPPEAVP